MLVSIDDQFAVMGLSSKMVAGKLELHRIMLWLCSSCGLGSCETASSAGMVLMDNLQDAEHSLST